MSQAWIDEMAAQWFAKAQEGMSTFEHKAFEQWLHPSFRTTFFI